MTDRLPDATRNPRSYRHWTPVSLRFRDIDLLGHVNNVALAGWLEDARVALELPVQPMTAGYSGPIVVLAELRIQYLAETHWGDAIRVGTAVERLGRTSLTLAQAIFRGDECVVAARAVEVLIDPVTRAPMPWPAEFVALFEPHRIG